MTPQRPAAVTVVGILSIVWGSLELLCCSLCNGFFLVFMAMAANSPGRDEFTRAMAESWNDLRQIPGCIPVETARILFHLLFSVLLIISGIGLLNMQNWARICSFIYSIFAILLQLGALVYTLAYMNPAMARQQQVRPLRDNPFESMFRNFGAVVGAIIGMVYSIVLLIILLQPHVSAAFARRSRGDYYEGDLQEGEDDLGYGRRRD